MTYRELLDFLSSLSPEQLEQDVTILFTEANEFYPILGTGINTPDLDNFDVLDENHAYLMLDA